MLTDTTLNAIGKHAEFYERAAAFKGRPRERMIALGEADELFFRLYPHHYRALQVVRIAAQLGQPTSLRREPIQRCESRAVRLLTAVVTDAVACGDLELVPLQRPDDLAFSVWALVFGTRALMNTAVAREQLEIEDGYGVIRDTAGLLFDALGWLPLSDDWDFERTRWRVRDEVFPMESAQAWAA